MSRTVRRDYDRRAREYEDRWRWYLEATVERTLAGMEVRAGDRILDAGSGSGWLLRRLIGRPGPRLTGIDVSAGMLGIARRRLPRNVLLAQADAAALPFPAGSFDQVVSTSSFHFWTAPLEALRELFRVLRPGGRLVLTDWSRDFWGPKFRELYLRILDPAHFRTWRKDEAEGMLREAGFRVVDGSLYRIRPTWGMMTVRAERPPARP